MSLAIWFLHYCIKVSMLNARLERANIALKCQFPSGGLAHALWNVVCGDYCAGPGRSG
jgi:hypothetical protein